MIMTGIQIYIRAMDIGASSNTVGGKAKKSGKGRRVWSSREEEVLIQALKDAIHRGFKSENGFKSGYLVFLEDAMKKAFPTTDIRGMPHINSKIHVWKKTHGTLVTLLSRSGIGWNETQKMIEATDEAWESYLKTDSNASPMRYKSWPYYYDWCEIFGCDRATGEHAESFADAVQGVLNMSNDLPPPMNDILEDIFREVEDTGESISVGNQSAMNIEGTKNVSGKKRKAQSLGEETIVHAINNFADKTNANLSDFVKRMGRDEGALNRRKEVFDALGKIAELTMNERVVAASMLVNNPSNLDLFFGLPDEARLSLVIWLLKSV